MADTYDIMKEVAGTVIREELNLKVKREDHGSHGGGGEEYFTVQLQLGDEPIGDPVCIELTSHWDRDDMMYDLEIT